MRGELSLIMCCIAAGMTAVKCAQPSDSEYALGVRALRRRFLQESGYDPSERPTTGSVEPTDVHVALPIPDVQYFALVGEWFTVVMYLCQRWKEPRFTWLPEDYGLAHKFTATLQEIWHPNVVVLNAKRQDVDMLHRMVTVMSTGNTYSCAAMKVKTPCRVDLSHFPNDRQACRVRAGSSTYSDREVRISLYTSWGDPHTNASTEWVLEDITDVSHTEANRSFIDIIFHLRRTARRHRYTYTAPGISLAVAVLAAFWLPPDSHRRLTLACLNIFFLAVVLNKMSTIMAASASVPKMISFLGLTMLVELLTVAASVLVISTSRSNSGIEVPDSLHRFLSSPAGTFLCLNTIDRTSTGSSYETQEVTTFDESRERRKRWLIVAQAVDRVCFVTFGLCTLFFFS